MTITHDYEEKQEGVDLLLTIKQMNEFQLTMVMIAKNYERFDN